MAQIPVTLPKLSDAEVATIRTSMNAIKTLLAQKFVNLEPEDRQKFGSINEKNKLIINKVKDFRDNMPGLSNPEVDWTAFAEKATTRKNFMLIVDLINELNELCNDPRTLVDYSLYGDARKDYKYTKYKAEDDGGGAAGYEAKYEALHEFYITEGGPFETPTP